jgi:hypothetical protein
VRAGYDTFPQRLKKLNASESVLVILKLEEFSTLRVLRLPLGMPTDAATSAGRNGEVLEACGVENAPTIPSRRDARHGEPPRRA